jgi:hypothetical protein
MHLRPSPALVVAGMALFVALGGSAFAVSQAAQPRCATGAVRGIAAVTGIPSQGIANIPGQFTSNRAYFSRRFNCTGGATQVRRANTGVYEVRFPGNAALTAVVSAPVGFAAAVSTLPGGVFQIALYVIGRNDIADVPFVLVAV